VSAAYFAWSHGRDWRIQSVIPFIQRELEREGVHLGYVLPDAESAEALWAQIEGFEVLLLPEFLGREGSAEEVDVLSRVLQRYMEAGGGLLLIGAVGSVWPVADDGALFPETGLRLANQGVQDPDTEIPGISQSGCYWWTRQVTPHEVTAGVRCLAFPKIADYAMIATRRMSCSDDWAVLVRAEASARVYDHSQSHTSIKHVWEDTGEDEVQPPLAAAREFPTSRMAVLPIRSDFIISNLGNPGFPQVFMELGDGDANPSDGMTFVVNMLRWLAAPAVAKGVLGGYRAPPAAEVGSFPHPSSIPAPPTIPEAAHRYFSGVAGLRSSYAGGEATIAEYAAAAREAGLSWIAFADPWEELSDEEYAQTQEECRAVSGPDFLALPGIRYTDAVGLEWVFFRPRFLPRTEYLTADGSRLYRDGPYIWNAAGKSVGFARMPLGLSRHEIDPRTLFWQHYLPLWEYDGDELVADNTDQYLAMISAGFSVVPMAFHDVRDRDGLLAAASRCATVMAADSFEEARAVFFPEDECPYPLYHQRFNYVTTGPRIEQFDMSRFSMGGSRDELTAGNQCFGMRLTASSDVGLAEVAVLDRNGRIYRRFLPDGDERFTAAWTGIRERQHFFVVRVTDTQGRVACSSPRSTINNARGLWFCSDNQNALYNQNTRAYCQALHDFPASPENWVPHFFGWRGWDGWQHMVKQLKIFAPLWGLVVTVQTDDGAGARTELTPGEHGRVGYERPTGVPLAGYWCNVFRARTSRVIDLPEDSDGWPPFHVRRPIGPTPLTEHELTATVPACRADLENLWFRPEFFSNSLASYDASLALFEGTIRFKRDAVLGEVARPIELVGLRGGEGLGLADILVYAPETGLRAAGGGTYFAETVPPGGFVTVGPLAGAPFVANLGPETVSFSGSRDDQGCFLNGAIGMGRGGQRVAAGTEMRFRLVNGYLTRGDEDTGEVARDLAESLNLTGGTSGYPLTVRRGRLLDAAFILTLAADDYGVEFAAGPRRMCIDLPVRVLGLADNGCAAFLDRARGHFVFVPFVDGEDCALFQVAIDEGVDLWVGNIFVCDDPAIRLTLTAAHEGRPRLEVHNPTDRGRVVTVHSPDHAPMFGGLRRQVRVEPGASTFIEPEVTQDAQ